MTVVMKSNKVAIVRINTRSCDDRVAKIATDIFNDFGWFTFIRKCTDIETIFMIGVDRGFHFFKEVMEQFLLLMPETRRRCYGTGWVRKNICPAGTPLSERSAEIDYKSVHKKTDFL